MEDQSDHETQSYMCFPLSQIDKTHLESGNSIIMPASALSSSSQKLVCRMTFRIANSSSKSTLHYHCGVAEITADDGFVFLPTWMMKKLNVTEGDLVDITNTSLPTGNYIKVQPHTNEFITTLADPISVLKKALRENFACLTSGDSVVVNHKENKYLLHIVETKPSPAISLSENDHYEVEVSKPLDCYKLRRRKQFLGQRSTEILDEDAAQFLGQRNTEILEEDYAIYQPAKKKLKASFISYEQRTSLHPFTGKMVNVNLPDDVIRNILARLPTKLLGRSRCVSSHWNNLISDYYIKSLSRRKILLVEADLRAIGDNGPSRDVVKLPHPFNLLRKQGEYRHIKVIGTFNGIVILVVNHHKYVDNMPKEFTSHIILYNPLTGKSEILPDPYSPFYESKHAYGFGYGATKDDLKIVRFRNCTNDNHGWNTCWNTCDVFNLRERSWSTSIIFIEDANFFGDVGTFLNGSLYWCATSKIVALNVNEMVISEIHLPCTRISTDAYLGTLHGCLWLITRITENHSEYMWNHCEFNMWVMKMEEGAKNSWSESRLLTLDLDHKYKNRFQVINLADDGRILMVVSRNDVIIYDTSNSSYKFLKTSRMNFNTAMAIEYEECLTSPSII